jgi:hypothetical protein
MWHGLDISTVFLIYEIFFVKWNATFAYYFFISGLILGGTLTLISKPWLIFFVWPSLLIVYFAVSGSITIIDMIVLTNGVGKFGKPFLEAIIYSSVGAYSTTSLVLKD